MPRLFIIGGSDAGTSAALRARELDSRWQITVAVADTYPNFSICGILYFLSKEVPQILNLAHRSATDIRGMGIELLLNHRIEQINPAARLVTATGPSGETSVHSYDQLVVATGAKSIQPPISGLDLPGVFLLRWIADTLAFENFLITWSPRRVVIVGGGYIGLEMAEALTRRLSVTIVEMTRSVMTTVDPDLGQKVGAELERNGVRVVTGQPISILVAVAHSRKPNSPWPPACCRASKVPLKVNRRMETNVPDVSAAGDCVETWHRITQSNTYLPLGTTAHKQGRIAGENAVGGNRYFEGSLGTQSVRLLEYVIARTGFHDRDAMNAGFDPLSVDCNVWDHKVYYPGAKPMTIRVTGDRQTSKLLGAQIIGHYGTEVSKRIDIFAAAIHCSMSVEQLNDLDLSYTPPLSSPWDPVQMAAQSWSSTQRCASRAAAAE